MTWRSIPADEALDILQFWVDADWPMSAREAAELSAELGWSQDDEGWVSNLSYGLTFPDIEGIGPFDDPARTVHVTLTDHEKVMTPEFAGFVAARFADYVSGAEQRWGPATRKLDELGHDSAYWDHGTRGGVIIARTKVVEAMYHTAPEVAMRRANGEWPTGQA